MNIQYSYNQEDQRKYKEVFVKLIRKGQRSSFIFNIGIIAISILGISMNAIRENSLSIFADQRSIFALVLIALSTFSLILLYVKSRKDHVLEFKPVKTTLKLEDDKLIEVIQNKTYETQISKIRRMEIDVNHIIIYSKNARFIVIPVRAFKSEHEYQQFIDDLSSKVSSKTEIVTKDEK